MSETNCEAKKRKKMCEGKNGHLCYPNNVNDKVKYSLSGFRLIRIKKIQLRSARIKVYAVSYIESFGV